MYAAVRVKKLDCFTACNYQIGDRAYYQLKAEDRVIGSSNSARWDKPAVLHTLLQQKGLLPGNDCGGPDKKDEEKNSSELAAAASSCNNGTLACGTVNDTCKVIFLPNFYLLLSHFFVKILTIDIGFLKKPVKWKRLLKMKAKIM